MEELYKVDLWGKNDEDWQEVHKEYIDVLDRRMEFVPIREPFFLLDTTSFLEHIL